MNIFVIKLNRLVIFSLLLGIFCASTFIVFSKNNDDIPLPIVMYHSILKDESRAGDYVVPVRQFKEDIDFLLSNGYTPVTVKTLTDYVYNNSPLPDKPIMITFDDGFYNNYEYVYPYIKEKNIPIVISIVGKYTDDYTKTGEANPMYSYLRKCDIEEMNKSGLVEFQNHSYNLHSLENNASMKRYNESDEDYKMRLTGDLNEVQNMLRSVTGNYPQAFTYPFGKISNQSTDIIKEMGFIASLSCEEGINYINHSPDCLYKLKRYNRFSRYTTYDFFKKMLPQ